ncbi:MAG: endonuclease III [Candidatus Pacearchaeota archaeon]|jgi:endonuclease-3
MEKNISKVMDILSKKYNNFDDRTTLNRMRKNPDAFKILISCLLSLRAKDETTNKISKELFKLADTPRKIIKLPTKKLEKIIFSTGHYRKKAQTLKHVSGELIRRFNGQVPKTKEELLSIKGIGIKTANLVLAFAFGQEYIVVDTHVHRISNRLGWVNTKNADKTEEILKNIMPKKFLIEANGILILFGRSICLPISPWCSKCPVKKYCPPIGVGKRR